MRIAFAPCLLACVLLPVAATAQTTPAQNPANLGPAQTQTAVPPPAQGNPAAHTNLTGDIMQKLTNDPTLGAITLTAKVADDGTVTLNGVVASQQLADQAVAAVQSVPGVTKVTSNLAVNNDVFATPTANTGATMPVRSTTGVVESMNDPQSRIDQALRADPGLPRVMASIYGNRVSLIGTVTDKKAIARAVQIARQILPSYQLSNLIWVDPHPLAPPPLVPQGD